MRAHSKHVDGIFLKTPAAAAAAGAFILLLWPGEDITLSGFTTERLRFRQQIRGFNGNKGKLVSSEAIKGAPYTRPVSCRVLWFANYFSRA